MKKDFIEEQTLEKKKMVIHLKQQQKLIIF